MTATDTALAALDTLMAEWLGPSALENLYAERGDELRYQMVSAVFEHQDSAAVALDYCNTKKRIAGVRYFIGKLSDPT